MLEQKMVSMLEDHKSSQRRKIHDTETLINFESMITELLENRNALKRESSELEEELPVEDGVLMEAI